MYDVPPLRFPRRRIVSAPVALVITVAIQSICALFFVWEIAVGVFGVQRAPLSWQVRELVEIGASVGLILGVGVGAALLYYMTKRKRRAERQLDRASQAFGEVLEQRFTEWGLTPSERDVAWFTVKGLSISDIARLRQTSEGTVKAQSNAIYRKAGISGRTQLLSVFIEDLMGDDPGAGKGA